MDKLKGLTAEQKALARRWKDILVYVGECDISCFHGVSSPSSSSALYVAKATHPTKVEKLGLRRMLSYAWKICPDNYFYGVMMRELCNFPGMSYPKASQIAESAMKVWGF